MIGLVVPTTLIDSLLFRMKKQEIVIMNKRTENRLIMQGFTRKNIHECDHMDLLARWTPFACAVFGIIGIALHSSWYMWILGIMTSIGAFTKSSFYDRLLNSIFAIFRLSIRIPKQGNPRKLGCGIGAVMYILSGFGFYFGNMTLAYIPSIMMVVLGGFAALTNICFASLIYRAFRGVELSDYDECGCMKNP